MNADQADLIVRWYLELEKRIEGFVQTVPYRPDTAALFFPPLASILLDACSILDAVFREECQGSANRRKMAMPDYALDFEPRLALKNRRSLFLQYPPVYLQPFKGWTDQQGSYQTLKWWQDHTGLKHDRVAKHGRATLENCLLSLCALHQVVSQLPCFFSAAKGHNLLHFGDQNPDYIEDHIYTQPKSATILFESALLATPIGENEFPADVSQIDALSFAKGNRLWRLV